jgi:acyl-CoA thioesterase-1
MLVVKNILIIALALLFHRSETPKIIIFYGDSLTAGYGLSPELAFPAQAETILNSKGKKVKVVNAGLSGETTAGGLSRIDWVLRQPFDIFVLELGANDGLRGLPLEQTEKNLQEIINRVKQKNPKSQLIIAGMMVPPNMGDQYSTAFRNLFTELAKKNNAKLIPFLLEGVAGIEELNQGDGIHPNAEGHKKVAETVAGVLEKLL